VIDRKTRLKDIGFLRMKLADLRADIAEMEKQGEWTGLPENLEPAVVEQAVDVFKRIADYATSLGATKLAAEWIDASDAYVRITRAFQKAGGSTTNDGKG